MRTTIPSVEALPEVTALLGSALRWPPAFIERWVTLIGPARVRVRDDAGTPVAALAYLEPGQWYGGRSVPCVGVTVLGVVAEHRGRGHAHGILLDLFRERRDHGVALCVLHPSSLAVYRRAGFERAGSRVLWEAPLEAITERARDLCVERIDGTDAAPLAPLYRRVARQRPGHLDREPLNWLRILDWTGPQELGPCQRYRVLADDQVEGYAVLRTTAAGSDLQLADACFATRRAGVRLLTLMADHRAVASTLVWPGGLDDPLVHLLPDRAARIRSHIEWVVRVIDVVTALRARGYPRCVSAELDLEVHDPELPWNHGRFRLGVDDGEAEVARGGAGRVRLTAQGFAAVYTGHRDPFALARLGQIEGDDRELEALRTLFSSAPPSMTDMF